MIDPVDGTLNIANRFPLFTVSIALVERKRPIVGVVYDPLLDDLFVCGGRRGAPGTATLLPCAAMSPGIMRSWVSTWGTMIRPPAIAWRSP